EECEPKVEPSALHVKTLPNNTSTDAPLSFHRPRGRLVALVIIDGLAGWLGRPAAMGILGSADMITDPIFYRLFATSPETFFLVLGMSADSAREMAARYQYE